jgi:hypothetical protein
MKWLIAIGVLVGALVLASFVSAVVRKFVARPKNSEQIRSFAQPAGSLTFSIVSTIGLIGALGFVAPDALADLPKGVVSFLPRGLLFVLLIVVGGAVATLVSAALGSSLLRATGKPQHQLTRLVKSVLTGVFAILAVSQLGVNTRIVDMLVAGIIFSLALSTALLTAFGGRSLAGEIAAGRYLKRVLQVGDSLETNRDTTGTVQSLHGASVVLQTSELAFGQNSDTTTFVHVPNTELLSSVMKVTRRNPGSPSK